MTLCFGESGVTFAEGCPQTPVDSIRAFVRIHGGIVMISVDPEDGSASSEAFDERVVWVLVEPGLHLARRGSSPVGYVLAVRGGFVAFDAASVPLGRFPRLGRARRSVVPPGEHLRERVRDVRAWIGRCVASASWRVRRWQGEQPGTEDREV